MSRTLNLLSQYNRLNQRLNPLRIYDGMDNYEKEMIPANVNAEYINQNISKMICNLISHNITVEEIGYFNTIRGNMSNHIQQLNIQGLNNIVDSFVEKYLDFKHLTISRVQFYNLFLPPNQQINNEAGYKKLVKNSRKPRKTKRPTKKRKKPLFGK